MIGSTFCVGMVSAAYGITEPRATETPTDPASVLASGTVVSVLASTGMPTDVKNPSGGSAAQMADLSAKKGGITTGGTARAEGTGVVSVAYSDAASSNQTVITSRQLLFDYRRSIAMFEGDVVVLDPQMRILSERLIVVFGASNDVQVVTALDKVRIYSGDRQGTCERAVYRVPAAEILLTGSPVLRRERDVLKGDRITFWTDREVVVCEPGELVLSPESVKERP